jgi:hypothetical protein
MGQNRGSFLLAAALVGAVWLAPPAALAKKTQAPQSLCPGQQFCILPIAELTPGAIRTTSKKDVCTTKTSTIRNVPAKLKTAVYARYGYKKTGTVVTFEGLEASGGAASLPTGRTAARQPLQPIQGHPGQGGAEFEVDHLIPLELGGSNDIENLWPQSYLTPDNAWEKDQLEHRLHVLVCEGSMKLTDAQEEIRNNWIDAWQRLAQPNP